MSATEEVVNSSTSTLKRALAAIDQLQRELAQARRPSPGAGDAIAVVGLGCRLPGGVVDAGSYWKLLSEGVDAIGETPPDRWDVDAFYRPDSGVPGKTATRWGGFLDRIDEFDAAFFGIPGAEAEAMDPAQRLVLEVAWEALEDAGQAEVAGTRTGVFVGVIGTDYAVRQFSRPDDMTPYAITGNAHSVMSGRLAHLLDLRGPAVSVDTACSSSLMSVHLACQSLRTGEVDMALAGGVNVILSPLSTIGLSQFGMMSPDGRCHAFDARANGFVRGEGCGMVVLKRLSDAMTAGDDVLAVIRGGAVNQDGRSTSLTAPNVLSQRDLLRRALDASGVAAEQVSYIEAHGTGTPLGDPIEVEALADVYPAGNRPWHLGSVKTNLGHLEAAAGIAGLIKVILSLRHREIPASLHFERINPHISLTELPFEVPTRLTAWEPRQGRRIAGVSSFGLSGTNVHLLVEEGPDRPARPADTRRPWSVLALSGRTETALRTLVARHRAQLSDTAVSAADYCFSANTGRVQHSHRLAVVGGSPAELEEALAREADRVVPPMERDTGVMFLFGGGPDGGADPGTVRSLYEGSPVFRSGLDQCRELLAQQGIALLPDLLPTGLTDPAGPVTTLFATEYALTQVWQSWKVAPAAVLGQAAGEVAAAWAAGVLSLPDALRLATEIDWIGPPPLYSSLAGPVAVSAFQLAVGDLPMTPPRIPLVSGTDGELVPWHQAPDAGHWGRQVSRPMRFAEAMATVRRLGHTRFVEIGPDATLTGLLADLTTEDPTGPELLTLSSLHRGQDGLHTLLTSLAELYRHGVEIDWAGFDSAYARTRVPVPTTPFEPVRHWSDSARADLGTAESPGAAPASAEAPRTFRENLLQQGEPERFALLADYIRKGLDEALRTSGHRRRGGRSSSSPEIGLDQPFPDLGLDSLMAIGLRNQLQAKVGVSLPIATLLQEGTIRRVVEQALGLLGAERAEQPAEEPGDDTEALLAELAQLPEDEIRQLLQEEH